MQLSHSRIFASTRSVLFTRSIDPEIMESKCTVRPSKPKESRGTVYLSKVLGSLSAGTINHNHRICHQILIHLSASYYGLVGTLTMAFVGGYTVFLPGRWDVPSFLFSYAMIGICPVLFVFWKVLRRTQVRAPLPHSGFQSS